MLNDLDQLSLTNLNRTVYLVPSASVNPIFGDDATNPYFDSNSETTQTTSILLSELGSLKFSWARVWPKTELRAGYSLDDAVLTMDPIYFGFSKTQSPAKPTQYVNSGNRLSDHLGSAVFLITALAKDPGGFRQSVTTEVARIPCPPLKAAFSPKEVQAHRFWDGNDSMPYQSEPERAGITRDVIGDASQPGVLRCLSDPFPQILTMTTLIKCSAPVLGRLKVLV